MPYYVVLCLLFPFNFKIQTIRYLPFAPYQHILKHLDEMHLEIIMENGAFALMSKCFISQNIFKYFEGTNLICILVSMKKLFIYFLKEKVFYHFRRIYKERIGRTIWTSRHKKNVLFEQYWKHYSTEAFAQLPYNVFKTHQ